MSLATALRNLAKAAKPSPPPLTFPISAIDAKLLKVAAPHKATAELEKWVGPIRKTCGRYEIDTIRRVAAFITTLAHEGGFKIGARENMNYSAHRLAQVWPSRFRGPNAKARRLHRNPVAIANEVYANRMGNGPPSSGDGWRYRGNGPIQLTGKNNHRAFAKSVGMSVRAAADWIETLEGGVASAGWFWDENQINRYADTGGVEDETRRINGGLIGLAHRRTVFNRLVAELLRRESP